MTTKQKLELTWIGKDKQPKLEPRILLEDRTKSHHAKQRVTENDIFDNQLIFGDNLLALKALEQEFSGKVKCIYIDPPYNTGNAFEHYDDGLEHSIWLGLMRDRLEILKNLLSEDGTIIVHIDEVEQAYLKVMMDSIFGRNNFVNCIVVQDSHPSGLKLSSKDKKIIKTKSYMIVYRKSELMRINSIYKARTEWDTHFSIFMDTDVIPLKKEALKDVMIKESVISDKDKISHDLISNSKAMKFCFENRNNIFQSTKELPDDARNNSLKNKDSVYEYITNGGERNFAFNGRRLSPLYKSIHNVGIDGEFKEGLAKLLCDFWDDVDFNNSQNEGDVNFPNSKKPEYLIGRIITMFSNKGDLVLDSFAGSGTTGAVAHKMGRKWIMIELGDHCHTHIIPRLKKIIDGNDASGITKAVNWQGGGGFRYYCLAPSLLEKDKWGN